MVVVNILDSHNGLNSVEPCTAYLTFGPWLYMVPQYKPDSVLMLGYAGGTAAGLIRLFYGDVPIVAVDVESCENKYFVDLVQTDARDYIKDCEHFDSVIIDIYESGEYRSPEWVFEEPFVSDVSSKANYLILHYKEGDDVSLYNQFHCVKTLSLDDKRFGYYMINRVARLPVR